MLRTYISVTNTATQPGGRNSGNLDEDFIDVNGVIYDNYAYADPTGSTLEAIPTSIHPAPLVRADRFIEQNFYRIFYPRPDDDKAVRNNPWLSTSAIDLATCNVA